MRKQRLQPQLDLLRSQLGAYQKAQKVLDSIIKQHSLQKAMRSALDHNRSGVETIFSQIHSPAEFRGFGSHFTTLVRKADTSVAGLNEISTGQRAAFAFSIFLAQNSQLRDAPPVLIIDDPIAHVDDLNSLSLLDYLREVALTGKRQIFFATANDKLAAIFERKFEFLGERDYRRFNLRRDPEAE